MHQTGSIGHLTGGKWSFFGGNEESVVPVTKNEEYRVPIGSKLMLLAARVLGIFAFAGPTLRAQSGGNQTQSQSPAISQPAQDIPDAPSTVQPPAPRLPAAMPPEPGKSAPPAYPGEAAQQPDQDKQAPPSMPPIQTIPAGGRPRNQINPRE